MTVQPDLGSARRPASGDLGLDGRCGPLGPGGLGGATQAEAPDALLTLRPVAPNPSSGTATVTASLAASAEAGVEVFDVLGRSVTVLHDGLLATGETAWTWDAAGQPAGLYVVRLTAGAAVRTQTVTVVRRCPGTGRCPGRHVVRLSRPALFGGPAASRRGRGAPAVGADLRAVGTARRA